MYYDWRFAVRNKEEVFPQCHLASHMITNAMAISAHWKGECVGSFHGRSAWEPARLVSRVARFGGANNAWLRLEPIKVLAVFVNWESQIWKVFTHLCFSPTTAGFMRTQSPSQRVYLFLPGSYRVTVSASKLRLSSWSKVAQMSQRPCFRTTRYPLQSLLTRRA